MVEKLINLDNTDRDVKRVAVTEFPKDKTIH